MCPGERGLSPRAPPAPLSHWLSAADTTRGVHVPAKMRLWQRALLDHDPEIFKMSGPDKTNGE